MQESKLLISAESKVCTNNSAVCPTCGRDVTSEMQKARPIFMAAVFVNLLVRT